jgi:tetratricopeptide (TPR) repeat protein
VTSEGLSLYPDDLLFGLYQIVTNSVEGRFAKALEASRAYAAKHPEVANAWDELGRRYFNLGYADSAEVALRRALEIEPDWHYPHISLAQLAYCRGDVKQAIEETKQVLSQENLLPGQRYSILILHDVEPSLCHYYFELGQFERALSVFDDAQQYVTDVYRERGLGYYRSKLLLFMGRNQDALAWAESVLEQKEVPVYQQGALACWAEAMVALDSLQAARSAIAGLRSREAEKGGKVRYLANQAAAKLALAEGNPDAVLGFLEKMKSQGVHGSGTFCLEYWEMLARAHQMAGRLDDAVEVHQHLLRIFGDHALSHYELGKLYEEMNRPDEAEQEYTIFLDMWSEADEGLPQLEDARQQLAVLQARP